MKGRFGQKGAGKIEGAPTSLSQCGKYIGRGIREHGIGERGVGEPGFSTQKLWQRKSMARNLNKKNTPKKRGWKGPSNREDGGCCEKNEVLQKA